MPTKRKVTVGSYLPDMKVVYGAIQQQIAQLPAVMNLFTGESHRWYECGEVYQSRSSEAICHKYAGHPGKHAKRRSR